jgi:GNAT superfamily N-acetyltransferase
MRQIIRTDSSNTDFLELVALLDQGLRITDGDDFVFFTQFNKLDAIKNVVVVYEDNIAAGCGAFKKHHDTTVEIKRMFVREAFRGKGIAKEVLSELEHWAKELAYTECILETGNMLTNAIQLYQTSGYERTSNYGQYIGVATSVCMKKKI